MRTIPLSTTVWVQLVACAFVFGVGLLRPALAVPPAEQPNSATAPGASQKLDRVGYPQDYRRQFKVLDVSFQKEAPEVLTAYGNALVPSATTAAPHPFADGSVIVMEFAYALRDAQGKTVHDASGRLKAGAVEHIDVMKRGKDFGEVYGSARSGNWEYAGYRPDGSYSTPPESSAQCAACHAKTGATHDFVFPLQGNVG